MSLEAAKIEARRLLAQIATVRKDETFLSIAEDEENHLAEEKVRPEGVSLLAAIEEWFSLRAKVGQLIPKSVPDFVEELLAAKALGGVSQRNLKDRLSRLSVSMPAGTSRERPRPRFSGQPRARSFAYFVPRTVMR